MDNLVILLLTYVFIIIFGFIRGVKNEEDELSGVTIILDISLFFITIATFVITIYSTSTSLTTVIFLAINIIAVIISWTAKEIYNKLFLEEKKVKTKTLKKVIYKNYSKQHADLVLKFYKLLIKNNYAEEAGVNYRLKPFNPRGLSFGFKNLSYIERDGFGFNSSLHQVSVASLVIEFVNTNIEYANNKPCAESLEFLLLEKENAKRIIFLLNVFEDREKLKFLSTEEGEAQLRLIGSDLAILNYNIKENVDKVIKLNKQTKVNEMNEEFNLLRKNSFDKIEEMKK